MRLKILTIYFKWVEHDMPLTEYTNKDIRYWLNMKFGSWGWLYFKEIK